MPHSLEELNQQVVKHNSNRKHFERTPLELATQIQDEALELVQEITESLITGCPNTVVGEIGDLYILLGQLCDDLGINPAEAFEMKALRNERKYGDWTMSNGYTRDEAVRLSKETWKAIGGDPTFSHIYLDFLAED